MPLQRPFPRLAGFAILAAMLLWLLLLAAQPLYAQRAPVTSYQASKARAMLQQQLPCLGCHELNGDGGRVGPSLTTVAERRSAAYIEAIIADPQQVVPGAAMPRTRMPEAIRILITRYLARDSRVTSDTSVGTTVSRNSAARAGEAPQPVALYSKWCASCHGDRGAGDGPNARYLPVKPAVHADARAMSARSDDALFDVIAAGGSVAGKSSRMPSFGATLSASEMRALVAHIRVLCACEGPAWSRDGSNR